MESQPLHPGVQRFIEAMGIEAEADGLPRTAGRILGFLISADEPASLDQIADALQVSRASVSTNARLIEQIGAAERLSLPGDRKDYYELASRFPDRFFAFTRRRTEGKLSLAEEALSSIPESNQVARERIRIWLDFHAFLLEELDRVAENWNVRFQARPPASQDPR